MSTRFPQAELTEVPEDIAAKILEIQEKSGGFVPNVFLMFARRPAEFRAFFAYHDAIMLKEDSALTKGDREMIVTTISAANKCTYCVVAHGAILRIYEKKPLVADQVAVNYRTAEISDRQRAMLDFATKVNSASHEIADATSTPFVCTASATRTRGTSPRSLHSSGSAIAWRVSPACCPIRSST